MERERKNQVYHVKEQTKTEKQKNKQGGRAVQRKERTQMLQLFCCHHILKNGEPPPPPPFNGNAKLSK